MYVGVESACFLLQLIVHISQWLKPLHTSFRQHYLCNTYCKFLFPPLESKIKKNWMLRFSVNEHLIKKSPIDSSILVWACSTPGGWRCMLSYSQVSQYSLFKYIADSLCFTHLLLKLKGATLFRELRYWLIGRALSHIVR